VCTRGSDWAPACGPSTSPLDSGMPWVRSAIAFLIAPAVGVLTAWLIAFCIWAMPIGFAFSMAPLAYGVTVVVGVPAFLLSRSWKPQSRALWWYPIAGFVVACFVSVPLFFVTISPARDLSVLMAICGITAGLAFGLILGPKSNNRWRGP
jgi:hypothetical protein